MTNIYKTPDADLTSEETGLPPDFKLYKVSAIGIATFFGSILAGGYLLSRNFQRLGKSGSARKALIYSIIAAVVILIIGMLVPENIPNSLFIIPEIIVMIEIAKRQQREDIERHIKKGGVLESNWKALGISLLILFAIATVFILATVLVI